MKTLVAILALASIFRAEPPAPALCAEDTTGCRIASAADERAGADVRYDPAYVRIDYPMGDVPADTGVCADVLIRAYRALGVDLQQRVHEDMRVAFAAYPSKRIWGLTSTDRNIDHRRVENLRVYFERHGQSLTVSDDPDAFQPGDIVSWNLSPGGFLPHIGLVSDKTGPSGAPMIVHNIGAGPQLEDRLFAFEITGHYRYHAIADTGDAPPEE